MPEKLHLTGLSRTELIDLAAELGEPRYRADQLVTGLRKHRLRSFSDITDLPARLRDRLSRVASAESVKTLSRFDSTDGTRRYLMETAAGYPVEAVYIPISGRDTICFSSQSGCPLKCDFCLTASMGLLGNLSAGEIIEQIIIVLNDVYGERSETPHGTNLVAMGAGEPFLNFENLMKAVDILGEEKGLFIVPKRITVSTAGIVPRILDLAKIRRRPNLAVSLSAPNDELRDRLMPINRRWNLSELTSAVREYQSTIVRGESLTLEYVLLDGVNDSAALAGELAELVVSNGLDKVKVNLIPHNPADGLRYGPSNAKRIEAFREILLEKGIATFQRTPRGRDIFAACGQLAAKKGAQTQPAGN